MAEIRQEIIKITLNKAYTSTNNMNHLDKRYEARKQIISNDKLLTKDEKSEAVRLLNKYYDYNRILYKGNNERVCENCKQSCLAKSYCEICIQNHLKTMFSTWTSGNVEIDLLIEKCQTQSFAPQKIIEWIPYNNLKNVKCLTNSGFSETYSADWIDGNYKKWDSVEQQLQRHGTKKVILKRLRIESADNSWFDEAKSHLTLSNRWNSIAKCYGLTKDPSEGNFMLIMKQYDIDLRKYLQQNHGQLKWKERIKIIIQITKALSRVHKENVIHKNLHSGNILYSQYYMFWYVSDLNFCSPADKPADKSLEIYGKLPYIAPEVIFGEEHTLESDIYSLAMIMWEVSSGKIPFADYENDYDLATNIVSGMRPKIVSGTPFEYQKLMEKCWNVNPTKRPSINKFKKKIKIINKLYYHQNESGKPATNSGSIGTFNSKIYSFNDLPEPKNATKEQQHDYHKTQFDSSILDDSTREL